MQDFETRYKEKKARTEERASILARLLMNAGREEDLFRAAEDSQYREQLYKEFGI